MEEKIAATFLRKTCQTPPWSRFIRSCYNIQRPRKIRHATNKHKALLPLGFKEQTNTVWKLDIYFLIHSCYNLHTLSSSQAKSDMLRRTTTVESCQSQSYHTLLNCSLFIHALAKWPDITSFDAEMIALCPDGKATLISLTIILINTLEAGSHTTALARFYSMGSCTEKLCAVAF